MAHAAGVGAPIRRGIGGSGAPRSSTNTVLAGAGCYPSRQHGTCSHGSAPQCSFGGSRFASVNGMLHLRALAPYSSVMARRAALKKEVTLTDPKAIRAVAHPARQ